MIYNFSERYDEPFVTEWTNTDFVFMSIKFKRFSIVAPSNTFKCTHCLKYFMFNYLAMMPNCSEGNLYKSQDRQLIKLADQDIEDNHPHLMTTHLIQIKLVF